jgi:hypothetical protein
MSMDKEASMSALENALAMEQEKHAQAQMQEQGLTPVQAGYLDAMAKLGYEVKAAAEPAMPPSAPKKPTVQTPPAGSVGPGATPPPAMAKGKGRAAPAGTGGFKGHVQKTLGRPGAAPAAPALGGRKSRSPLG